jgi:hypothetical protein
MFDRCNSLRFIFIGNNPLDIDHRVDLCSVLMIHILSEYVRLTTN